jgi:hypothetical protein
MDGRWEYRVVLGGSSFGLAAEISGLLNDGWECVGGVAFYKTGSVTFAQSMMRYVRAITDKEPTK